MKGYRMTQLTTEKVREWESGKWHYTYTNWLPQKALGIIGVSGRYGYKILFFGTPPKRIPFSKVPKGYREALKKDKPIYKTKAVLLGRFKREGMR